jgi:hypothetical protein
MPLEAALETLAAECAAANVELAQWRSTHDAPVEAVYQTRRRIASRATLVALDTELVTPLREGVIAAVRYHLFARLAGTLEAEHADAAADEDRRLDFGKIRPISFEAARTGLLQSTSVAEARAHWQALQSGNDTMVSFARRRHELYQEIAEQLSAQLSWAAPSPIADEATVQSARVFLDSTEELAKEAQRRAAKPFDLEGGDNALACILHTKLAKTAACFPQQLTPRWFAEALPNLALRRCDPKGGHPYARVHLSKLPHAVGGSTYMRALYKFGLTLRTTLHESAQTTVERADPAGFDAHAHAAVLAQLTLSKPFLLRALQVTGDAKDVARMFAECTLFALRKSAATAVAESNSERDDLARRVFGEGCSAGLAAVLLAWRPASKVHFAAQLTSRSVTSSLCDMFDEDWFRNPRAREYFSAAGAPTALAPADLPGAARSYASYLEQQIA